MTTAAQAGIEFLVAEIGSTTTTVSAFGGDSLLGWGMAPTTVAEGDVTAGLERAMNSLAAGLRLPGGREALRGVRMLASSSAAGGLRMSVHGLVYDMTVRAAREAALGAGAVLRMVTAGVLSEADLGELRRLQPNIILLAGGVDHGETETVLANASRLAGLGLRGRPVIYAGNVAVRGEVERILRAAGMRVSTVENVYPRIDELNVEPTRKAVQDVFEEHIVRGPGMERLRELVQGRILPTPGAVMIAARLLYGRIGDLVVLDVGGATTDVHSVTEGSEEIARLMVSPEPLAKRTVEGDLGVYVNAERARRLFAPGELEARLGLSGDELEGLVSELEPVPSTDVQFRLAAELTRAVVRTAVLRHAGRIKHLYGPSGRMTVAEGKDLTQVHWIIGTGGALTRLPGGAEMLRALRAERRGLELLPPAEAEVLLDGDYVLAAGGVFADEDPRAALAVMFRSLGLSETESGVRVVPGGCDRRSEV